MSGKRDKRKRRVKPKQPNKSSSGKNQAISLDETTSARFKYAVNYGKLRAEQLKAAGIKPSVAVQIANSGKVSRPDLVDKVVKVLDDNKIELPEADGILSGVA